NALAAKSKLDIDLASYFNYYSYQKIGYYGKILKTYQEIYYMQLAQLAYHYACGSNISFTNLASLPAAAGKDSFDKSVEILNTTYQQTAEQLYTNLGKYMAPLSNAVEYNFINNKVAPNLNLLDKNLFNTNQSNQSNQFGCNLAKFQIISSGGGKSGILNIVAACSQSGNKDSAVESFNYEIPYSTDETMSKIIRAGQSEIGYDTATKKLITHFSNSLTGDDVNNIISPNSDKYAPGFYWANKESMNILAASWVQFELYQGYKDTNRYWERFNITSNTSGLKFYTAKWLNAKSVNEADDKNWWYDSSSYDSFMPSMGDGHIGVSDTNIQRTKYDNDYFSSGSSSYDAPWYATDANPWDHVFGYEYWFLGNYNGKTFAFKITTQKTSDTKEEWDDDGAPDQKNRVSAQAVGVFCVTDNCSRKDNGKGDNDNTTTLTWTDGTTVVFDNDDSDVIYASDHNITTVTGSITK
ncbi:MAG: hypothetical protein K2X94_00790, partial [Amoebophilaceae bacterium]|nr:hypothetical protein [Amoebophilaceae bacterium]